ncbi:MAG: tRNA pseudouridine(38-40) synthase TruA [Bacteroidales bacterium]|nr:tRNA pseudouridine(38-40) synthase TruA [Bacteroidales bacterium]
MAFRYFIKMAYDGTYYHGWQIQPNGHSVQEEMEKVLGWMERKAVAVTGAGRTDTGVHALEMYAHVDLDTPVEQKKDEWLQQINHKLSTGIVVNDIIRVNDTAHARFDAISRTYNYFINTRKDPFSDRYAWLWYGELNIDMMNEGAVRLLGEHDFKSFSKVHTDVTNFLCTVYASAWTMEQSQLLFSIKANRFLRNMVRAIVGTLLDLGRGHITLKEFDSIIATRHRSAAGMSVPAKGLFLTHIEYPDNIWFAL